MFELWSGPASARSAGAGPSFLGSSARETTALRQPRTPELQQQRFICVHDFVRGTHGNIAARV